MKRNILFNVTGYNDVGLGHVYNTLGIASKILNHNISFIFDKKSFLGYSIIKKYNYKCYIQSNKSIIDDIIEINPDVVINDCLGTKEKFILQLKKQNYKVINFEDKGIGAKYADLVINAIYEAPKINKMKDHFYGYKYFILRDEFNQIKPVSINKKVSNVLITFGGVDPNNYTLKVIESINSYCLLNKINITVIAGIGYNKYETLDEHIKNITIIKNTKSISDYMSKSDIIFSSAGRTTFETASLGVPTIVLSQNTRESTHFFSKNSNGFINLGLGYDVNNEIILSVFKDICSNYKKRKEINKKLLKHDFSSGMKRVLKLINNKINE